MNERPACPEKDGLVTYLYGEDLPDEHRRITDHLTACGACREEVAALGAVRAGLAAWPAPGLDVHMQVARAAPQARSPWAEMWRWVCHPAFGLAAAATLVLGLAAALSNLEVGYGAQGFLVRTGRPRGPVAGPASAAVPASVPSTGAEPGPGPAPWRADVAALERQLRREFGAQAHASPGGPPSPGLVSARAERGVAEVDPELRRLVQRLIDESEVRQQQNLALRVAELSRDFDVQRRSDLVRIEQGLGRLEGQTQAEAARTRQLVNYMMRVSQPPPR